MGTTSIHDEPIRAKEFNGAMEVLRGGQERLERSIDCIRSDMNKLFDLHVKLLETQNDRSFKDGQEEAKVIAIDDRLKKVELWNLENVRHKRNILVAMVTVIFTVIGSVLYSLLRRG